MANEGQVVLRPIPGSAENSIEVTAILDGDEYKWTEGGMDQVDCCGGFQWGHDPECDRIYGESYLHEVSALTGWPDMQRGDLSSYHNRMRYATWLHQHRSSKTCSYCLRKFRPYDGDSGFCWDCLCWEPAQSVGEAHDDRGEDGTGAAGDRQDEWEMEQWQTEQEEWEDEEDY